MKAIQLKKSFLPTWIPWVVGTPRIEWQMAQPAAQLRFADSWRVSRAWTSFLGPQKLSFPHGRQHHTTTGPPTPQVRFRRLRLPRSTPGNQATSAQPTAPSVATSSNPKTRPTIIFLAQILGHKLLGPNASLSVGQSYKDFYIRSLEPFPVEKKGYSNHL
jgi:hypothetical protein